MNLSLYGKYAGKLEPEKNYLKNCSEMELFIQVSAYYEPIRSYYTMITALSSLTTEKEFYKTSEEKELAKYIDQKTEELAKRVSFLKQKVELYNNDEEWKYAMDFCILQTARFGTKVTYNPTGRIKLTKEFEDWYNNWQAFTNYMDDETLAYYRICRYEGKGLDKFQLNMPIEKDDEMPQINNVRPYTYQLNRKSTKQKLA